MIKNLKQHFIRSFQIKNFRGILDSGKIELPADTRWVFLTGENGFGKTSVLQALAVALYGKNGLENIGNPEISVETATVVYKSDKGGGKIKKLAAYGSSRLNIVKKDEDYQKSSTLYNLFYTDGVLKNIDVHLGKIYGKQKFEKQFSEIEDVLKKLLPIQKIEVDTSAVDNKVYYTDPQGTKLLFDELAAGYKNIIAMIGDMVLRLLEQQKNNSLSKLQGIAIIDELDLHLHPKWQRELPSLLSGIFPNVQFFVSTHSPIPLLGAPAESVFLKVTRTKEEGTKIENLDYVEVRNLTPNTILTSPIFDFEELIPESHVESERLRTEETYKQVKINDETRAFLREVAKKLKNGESV